MTLYNKKGKAAAYIENDVIGSLTPFRMKNSV